MRIVHRDGGVDRVVEIDIDDPGSTVGDLLVVLAQPGATATRTDAVIDGVAVTADRPLSAVTLCEGSVLETAPAPPTTSAHPAARTLAVVGGLHAGLRVTVHPGATIGRGTASVLAIADSTLSRRHLSVTAGGVRDLGSRNGTSIEGHPLRGATSVASGDTIRVGTTRLAFTPTVDDCPVAVATALGAVGGTIPFNRPPRTGPDTDPPSVVVPAPPPPAPDGEPIPIAGIVLPVIAGGIVAVLFSPFMAVFAALGPVLTIGTWWERRRRARRGHREARSAFVAALDEFTDLLPGLRRAEIDRRRRLHPDPAEVVRRATGSSVHCWLRRPDHPDAFVVALGCRDEPLRIPLLPESGDVAASEVNAAVAALPSMPDVPVAIDLSAGHVLGLVGDREASVSVARSLVLQMATHHGPADLAIVVAADHLPRWEWCTWLPHTTDQSAGRRGAHLLATGDMVAADGILASAGERTVLAVLDGDDPLQGRNTVGRRLLRADDVSAVVLVPDAHRLPAGCDTVVTVDQAGRMRVVDPRRADAGRDGLVWGIGATVANDAARCLARLDDPELPVNGAGVPPTAPLLATLGVDGDDPDTIEQRWRRTDGTAELTTTIGVDGRGPVLLDLVADGPHVLIGGTTGSGKSELLRSMVAGLAANADPDHVAFVLVDYKGGAAFDCCADLPHVAGLVTDLDDTLAARALRCLEAELRHRERRLREVGAEDIAALRATPARRGADPLPRLVVVVDEFATLAADLPDFLDALVGIAQRGRSLGVHLVLATQRPAGVVTEDIRANTSCRIALRVTDRNDSMDVIDVADAAALPRSLPGRAVARFGPGELVTFQSVLATGRSRGRAGVSVRGQTAEQDDEHDQGSTDLDRLVRTITTAHARRGGRPPRSPWPPHLPGRVLREELGASMGARDWLLVDEPDRQRQSQEGWNPSGGHLVVLGGAGSGVTTTLASAVLAATRGLGPAAPHVHVIDLASGALAPLADLPAAGTVTGPSDAVRRERLVRWLDDEVTRRRGGNGWADHRDVPVIVAIDDLGGLARAHDPVREAAIHERFARIWAEGPAVGVTMAVSIRRGADLGPALAATAGTVLLHRSTDPSDGLRFAVKASTAGFGPGRALRVSDQATVQVVLEAPTIAEAVRMRAGEEPPEAPPHEVRELGSVIVWSEAEPAVTFGSDGVEIRFGIRDRDLAPAALRLHRGEHAVVLGPARSGRTNMLAVVARAAGDAAVVLGDGELVRRSGVVALEPGELGAALSGRRAVLVLVDDCLTVDDSSGELAALVDRPPPGVHLIVAARPDRYRSAYGHWAADIRASRVGVLLRPDPIDGDLLGQQLPARLRLPPVAGRGIAIADGRCETVQVVSLDVQSSAG